MSYQHKECIVQAVQITAADWNGDTFDGCPFSKVPDWLMHVLKNGRVTPVDRNSTDYTDWKIINKWGNELGYTRRLDRP